MKTNIEECSVFQAIILVLVSVAIGVFLGLGARSLWIIVSGC